MKKVVVNAPAKINFGLNIISKRKDGFHNIETIFYPVKFFDRISFSESDEFSFFCDNSTLMNEPDNLIIKAKNLLEESSNKKITVSVNLKKNIPVGAGLGGGSSDAASALLVLNEICGLRLNSDTLKDIALNLGSDVPFFLDPVPSFAESRGEILSPTDFRIDLPILIVNPGIHVSTFWAYNSCKAGKPEYRLQTLVGKISEMNISELQTNVVNDFEITVFEEFPEIAEIKNTMYEQGALFSLMTGSGSTVFGIFDSAAKAESVQKYFSRRYFAVIC